MKALTQINWHELPADQVAETLDSAPATGLAQSEVEARLKQFGPNQMTSRKRLSEWMRFLLQFHQPLIYILLAATRNPACTARGANSATSAWRGCRE